MKTDGLDLAALIEDCVWDYRATFSVFVVYSIGGETPLELHRSNHGIISYKTMPYRTLLRFYNFNFVLR